MPKQLVPLSPARTCSFIFLLAFALCLLQTFVQSGTVWKYIAQSSEGKYYVKFPVDKLKNSNRAQWMKIISPDGEEQISYSEWDCNGKRFRSLQTSSYAQDGTALSHQKNLDWAEVVSRISIRTTLPGSVRRADENQLRGNYCPAGKGAPGNWRKRSGCANSESRLSCYKR